MIQEHGDENGLVEIWKPAVCYYRAASLGWMRRRCDMKQCLQNVLCLRGRADGHFKRVKILRGLEG